MARLIPWARQGIPVIGVEPSCIACFRDEYPDLLPGADARTVASQAFFFEEFIADMAGAFGYEKEHYEISMAIGEQRLFPAVRAADPRTIIAAAGSSCREQIKDGARRPARHPIAILADGLL